MKIENKPNYYINVNFEVVSDQSKYLIVIAQLYKKEVSTFIVETSFFKAKSDNLI